MCPFEECMSLLAFHCLSYTHKIIFDAILQGCSTDNKKMPLVSVEEISKRTDMHIKDVTKYVNSLCANNFVFSNSKMIENKRYCFVGIDFKNSLNFIYKTLSEIHSKIKKEDGFKCTECKKVYTIEECLLGFDRSQDICCPKDSSHTISINASKCPKQSDMIETLLRQMKNLKGQEPEKVFDPFLVHTAFITQTQ
jgi:predicted transcriptional regulator